MTVDYHVEVRSLDKSSLFNRRRPRQCRRGCLIPDCLLFNLKLSTELGKVKAEKQSDT